MTQSYSVLILMNASNSQNKNKIIIMKGFRSFSQPFSVDFVLIAASSCVNLPAKSVCDCVVKDMSQS